MPLGWWHPWTLATLQSPWDGVMPVRKLRGLWRQIGCRSLRGGVDAEARREIVRLILDGDPVLCKPVDPYVLRPWSQDRPERPLFLVAEATPR